MLDLYRKSSIPAVNAVRGEEQLIRAMFGLLNLLIKQGIACNFVYRSADGTTICESVDNPDYPDQLLLKVLAVKVIPDTRVDIRQAGSKVCACIIGTTDAGPGFAALTDFIEDPDSISIIGLSVASVNSTSAPLWYLDEDNNFKMV